MQIDPSALSDQELRQALTGLAGREREATAQLVAHLAELETRGLHLQDGYGSLFEYCHEQLKLTDAEAYLRIEAARVGRKFPLALELLADGAVSLTTLKVLAPHLTAENHAALLAEARHKRKYQVEEIAARLAPRPAVPTVIRALPQATPLTVAALSGVGSAAPSERPAPSHPVVLAPERYALQATIDRETRHLLDRAREALRHANPSGDLNVVLKRALGALLAQQAKEVRRANVARPTATHSRHVPVAIQREIFRRDAGTCVFKGATGRTCGSRAFVQIHHVRPWMAGGPSTAENLELRCAAHNRYEAAQFYAARSGTSG